jgi:hypothetical protein
MSDYLDKLVNLPFLLLFEDKHLLVLVLNGCRRVLPLREKLPHVVVDISHLSLDSNDLISVVHNPSYFPSLYCRRENSTSPELPGQFRHDRVSKIVTSPCLLDHHYTVGHILSVEVVFFSLKRLMRRPHCWNKLGYKLGPILVVAKCKNSS